MRWQLFLALGIELVIMAFFQRTEIILLFLFGNTAVLLFLLEKQRRNTVENGHLPETRTGDILAELDRQAKLAAEAQLLALQAQINPHFLFNVLNTIIATSRTNPHRTRRLLMLLAQFLRRALTTKETFISLKQEMEFVHIYLILEKIRFGRKLVVKEEIDEQVWDLQIPRLSIQPLVENAVKHGITAKIGSGMVLIKVSMVNSEIVVQVKDDGAGISADRLQDVLKNGVGSGNGVGLANVQGRLQAIYGKAYGLKIQSKPGKGTTVTMSMPLTAVDKVV